MELVFFMVLISFLGVVCLVNMEFNSIAPGDTIMYYDEYNGRLPIYDVVKRNHDGELITENGKWFDVWDLLKGNIFYVKTRI